MKIEVIFLNEVHETVNFPSVKLNVEDMKENNTLAYVENYDEAFISGLSGYVATTEDEYILFDKEKNAVCVYDRQNEILKKVYFF